MPLSALLFPEAGALIHDVFTFSNLLVRLSVLFGFTYFLTKKKPFIHFIICNFFRRFNSGSGFPGIYAGCQKVTSGR